MGLSLSRKCQCGCRFFNATNHKPSLNEVQGELLKRVESGIARDWSKQKPAATPSFADQIEQRRSNPNFKLCTKSDVYSD